MPNHITNEFTAPSRIIAALASSSNEKTMIELAWLERRVKWIAVTDGVPPIGRRVLGTSPNASVHEAFRNHKGNFRWAHGDTAPDITHWMELPTAPAQFELDRIAEKK